MPADTLNHTAKSNVVLIGMPGAGKSTVGVVLAKRLGLNFVDTDLLIQAQTGQRLQAIIDTVGLARFRAIEEQVLLETDVLGTVIATGGSVIYSDAGMAALRARAAVVFLDVPAEELERRIMDMDERGVVIDPGQTFSDLYANRQPLYKKFADIVVPCEGRSVEEIAGFIQRRLASP